MQIDAIDTRILAVVFSHRFGAFKLTKVAPHGPANIDPRAKMGAIRPNCRVLSKACIDFGPISTQI